MSRLNPWAILDAVFSLSSGCIMISFAKSSRVITEEEKETEEEDDMWDIVIIYTCEVLYVFYQVTKEGPDRDVRSVGPDRFPKLHQKMLTVVSCWALTGENRPCPKK